NNIVTLTLDMSGRTTNVINHEIAEAFVPVIEHLKAEKEKGQLRGVILTSAKKSFLTGGDLEYLYQAGDPQEIFRFAEQLK
ncbi:MAG: 3-hydroxybutyryl-CoA epimerase, partial [Phaeodactylibacter sp.]|nr:3-hydroxybutyryl-CoA epimerase [Phaeodactylibacter sp.]